MANPDTRLRRAAGLLQRVAALEAARLEPPSDSQTAALSAAVAALFDAAESGADSWNKRQSGCDFLLALQARLNTDRDTAADRAMMDALSACHLPPCSLVLALCELLAGNERRD